MPACYSPMTTSDYPRLKTRKILLLRRLGSSGIGQVDQNLRRNAQGQWLKVARIVAHAMRDGGFEAADNVVNLHVRRVIALVESGTLEGQGDLRKPRWSEVRTSQ